MYRKVIGVTAFIFGASLPIFTKLGNVSFGALMVLVLIWIIKERQVFEVKYFKKQIFLSTVIIFVMIIYGLLVTQEFSKGITMIERSFTYCVFPILLFFVDKDMLSRMKNFALRGIIYGTSVAAIILLTNNFVKYFNEKQAFVIDNDLFNYYHTYLEFTSILNMHPTYIGMYFITALSALIFVDTSINKTLKWFFGVLFLVTIIFLNSRTVLMLATCLSMIIVAQLLKKFFFQNKAFFYGLITLLFVFVFGVLHLLKDTYMYSRVTKELRWELTQNVNSQYNNKFVADSRLSRWMVTLDLIKEKPALGYGTGSGETVLNKAYLESGLNNSANNSYDTHNQFLHVLLEYGFIGLLLFTFYLSGNTVIAIRSRDWNASVFFIMLVFCGLFENIFKFNAGIIFIAFFSNIYMFLNTKK